jgi:hypothetical protein
MGETDRQYLRDPLLRVQADEALAGRVWGTGEPNAGAAADAHHGDKGHLPAAKVYPYLKSIRIC